MHKMTRANLEAVFAGESQAHSDDEEQLVGQGLSTMVCGNWSLRFATRGELQ